MMNVRSRLVMLAVVGMLAGGACASGSSSSAVAPASHPSTVDSGSLAPGDPIPRPEGEQVLLLTGDIAAHNHGEVLELDLATLEQMPSVQAEVYEPFLKKNLTFSGVLLSDLFEIVGVTSSSLRVDMTALDDYHVGFSLGQLDASSVMLATESAGAPIEVADGGPIRIVFLSSSVIADNSDNWIWSVRDMEFS